MTAPSLAYPALLHRHRHCDNGLYPEVSFHAQAVAALNHLVAYRRKLVYRRVWPLTTAGGSSGVVVHWHCKTGYGAKRLVIAPTLGFDDHAAATNPYITVAVTKVGGATTSLDFHGGLFSGTTTDAPEQWLPQMDWVDVDPNATYTGAVTFNDNVRLLELDVFEEYVVTADEATDYFSEWQPSAGSPIYKNRIGRLLAAADGLVRVNRGLRADWSRDDGTARTRMATAVANPFDDSMPPASTPTASTPGWTFDTTGLNTASRTTVPILLCAYASVTGGTGSVKLRDTNGTDFATVTVNGAAGWYTQAGSMPVGSAIKCDPLYLGDGSNTLSLYAISVYAIE